MDEIIPGLLHWTAFRDTIGADVHSYLHAPSGTVLDPMVPPEGLDAFGDRAIRRVVLTNRHHYRDADAYRDRFGATVHCHEAGLHEFGPEQDVQGFAWGDELAAGVIAHEVGVLCPEETAIHLDGGGGALAFADAVTRRRGGALGFFGDSLLGEDPEAVRAGLRAAFARLASGLDFEAMLLAHGDPVAPGAREQLAAFADG
ncbi:MAG TPA: hypothetical protein VH276_15150 [Solirubrobacteraceae bacterium]|jgi:hypothetical protein|nr:hypothetical protein [Solirubrobacteraceae bacterium]